MDYDRKFNRRDFLIVGVGSVPFLGATLGMLAVYRKRQKDCRKLARRLLDNIYNSGDTDSEKLYHDFENSNDLGGYVESIGQENFNYIFETTQRLTGILPRNEAVIFIEEEIGTIHTYTDAVDSLEKRVVGIR